MRFRRSTHDDDGNVKPNLPDLRVGGDVSWITCCIHMISPGWQTLGKIYENHLEYDRHYGVVSGGDESFGYSIADILSGLAILIRLGVVEARAD